MWEKGPGRANSPCKGSEAGNGPGVPGKEVKVANVGRFRGKKEDQGQTGGDRPGPRALRQERELWIF